MPEAAAKAGPAPAFSLAGRTAVVTGASRGLGHAIARALGAAGAVVALNGRHERTLERACRALAAEGIEAAPLPFDVADGRAGEDAIAPGYIATELTRPLYEDETFNAFVCRRTPAGRWGRPEEVGMAALYLASEDAAYVNGHVLTVDGGMTVSLAG